MSLAGGGPAQQGAHAGLPVRDALVQLLEGTGLQVEYLNDHTVRLKEGTPAAAAVLQKHRGPRADAAVRAWPPVETTDEILVTATKREESLGLVPMRASVFSADRLSAMDIKGINDISAVTPGSEYNFSTQFVPGLYTNFVIRGIDATKGNPTTGIYLNDTPLQMPHSNLSYVFPVTFDLERVEVLRGPQGVLFGAVRKAAPCGS